MMQAIAAAKVAEDILIAEGWTGITVRPTMHKSTYFRPEARNTGKGSVTFGGKMIHLYTSGAALRNARKELQKCGFGNSLPFLWCPAAAAVLIVCHELAHVGVHRKGLRVRGSMHGGPFYREMRRLIDAHMEKMSILFSSYAHDTALVKFFSERALQLAESPARTRLNAALAEAYPAPSYFSGRYRKEDLVVFTIQGEKKIGRLMRRGKKRWTVKVDGEVGVKYYVPEKMLRLCGQHPSPVETRHCAMCDEPFSCRHEREDKICPNCQENVMPRM